MDQPSMKENFINQLQLQFNVDMKASSLSQRYHVLAALVQQQLKDLHEKAQAQIKKHQLKKTIYFSMEFLMGRMITNNLYSLGIYNEMKSLFEEHDLDIHEVEDFETDAGLGNGGLGRLAACFLDSAAALRLPLYGNSIRYSKGFFVQTIEDFKQQESPDPWLETPYMWEERKEDEAIDIPYYGYIEHTQLKNPIWVKAVPYDMYIAGDQNSVSTRLRLWSTEPSEKQLHKDHSYLKMVSTISEALYPDDSKDDGKTLRLQQQYLFSAAGVQDAIREHKSFGLELKSLPDHYSFQLNDTHPAVVIPEMMRILMDEEGFGYDEAWEITTKTCAYTNHTILSEALEKWNKVIYRNLLPRIYEIIQEMNRRFNMLVKADGRFNENENYLLQLIGSNHVRMANIAIYGSFSVNGVAALHTNILKQSELKMFYMLFPHKFNNKTNGVTHRRWLIQINQELIQLLESKIGDTFKKDLTHLKKLESLKEDVQFLKDLKEVKQEKQAQLIKYVKDKENVTLIKGGIFDIQIKRLHEYKRQLMNILHIIHVYLELKSNPTFKANYVPHNFIFGAKAAPSYTMAKEIIELINRVSYVINNDHDVKDVLKVVFVTNYNVTYAEKLIPAADVSEQISTATKEASGTGNMKFMMNGALTLGTLDGANVEIVEEAGEDNVIIFGLTAEEVTAIYKNNHYDPKAIYDQDVRLQRIFEFIRKLTNNPQHFDFILSNLLNNDYFLVFKDFDAYVRAHETANEWFKDPLSWSKKTLLNIANSSFFSSDRTIKQYNHDLWHLEEI
jgi:glycogen phosphorylase